jgi:hypothetical protein
MQEYSSRDFMATPEPHHTGDDTSLTGRKPPSDTSTVPVRRVTSQAGSSISSPGATTACSSGYVSADDEHGAVSRSSSGIVSPSSLPGTPSCGTPLSHDHAWCFSGSVGDPAGSRYDGTGMSLCHGQQQQQSDSVFSFDSYPMFGIDDVAYYLSPPPSSTSSDTSQDWSGIYRTDLCEGIADLDFNTSESSDKRHWFNSAACRKKRDSIDSDNSTLVDDRSILKDLLISTGSSYTQQHPTSIASGSGWMAAPNSPLVAGDYCYYPTMPAAEPAFGGPLISGYNPCTPTSAAALVKSETCSRDTPMMAPSSCSQHQMGDGTGYQAMFASGVANMGYGGISSYAREQQQQQQQHALQYDYYERSAQVHQRDYARSQQQRWQQTTYGEQQYWPESALYDHGMHQRPQHQQEDGLCTVGRQNDHTYTNKMHTTRTLGISNFVRTVSQPCAPPSTPVLPRSCSSALEYFLVVKRQVDPQKGSDAALGSDGVFHLELPDYSADDRFHQADGRQPPPKLLKKLLTGETEHQHLHHHQRQQQQGYGGRQQHHHQLQQQQQYGGDGDAPTIGSFCDSFASDMDFDLPSCSELTEDIFSNTDMAEFDRFCRWEESKHKVGTCGVFIEYLSLSYEYSLHYLHNLSQFYQGTSLKQIKLTRVFDEFTHKLAQSSNLLLNYQL